MSQPQYISLFQFFKIFPDEKAAQTFFEKSRWPDAVRCPRCDKKETVSIVANAKPQPYHCKGCRKYFSVKVGTVMEASPIPLRTWLAAIYLMTVSRKGISSCQLARQLDIQQKTAYFLLARIREAWDVTGNSMLCGTIECDEAYFGGKEKNKHANKKLHAGRGGVGKTAVIAMKERDRNRVTAFPIKSTDSATLQGSIKDNVTMGSTLYTDEHRSYAGISGYKHETISHSVGEYVRGMAYTNGVVLMAFEDELRRLCEDFGQRFVIRVFQYLLGTNDFYKVIKDNGHVAIQSFNITGSLEWGKKWKIPERIESISRKRGSSNTLIVSFVGGWQLSFRIHNAEKFVIPSLKFDIKFIGMPQTVARHEILYKLSN